MVRAPREHSITVDQDPLHPQAVPGRVLPHLLAVQLHTEVFTPAPADPATRPSCGEQGGRGRSRSQQNFNKPRTNFKVSQNQNKFREIMKQ